MNKKILSGIALGIILVSAVIFGRLVWLGQYTDDKNESQKLEAPADNDINSSNFQENPPDDLDGKVQNFEKFTTDDDIVYFSQRTIGNAIVEKDQSVYVFSKSDGKMKEKNVKHRSDLPENLPENLITKEQAEASVEGSSKHSALYFASPDSDVFNIDFDRSKPIWSVTSFDSNNVASLTIIDATTGEKLGNGIPPPSSAYSMTGPINYQSSCNSSWSSWSNNAATWFEKMGYPTNKQEWPLKTDEKAEIEDPNSVLFYELAHGNSTYFINSCSGTAYEKTSASDIKNWINSYPAKMFAFIGSCDGLCNTGAGTLSYEFRKGSDADAVAVGYCNMSGSACSSCWGTSLSWQNKLFDYINQGFTVKNAFDKANIDYPICTNCMRLAGDANIRLTDKIPDNQIPTASITFPADGALLSGSSAEILVSASDNIAVTKAELYKDGNIFMTIGLSMPSYNFIWNFSKEIDGNHTLQAHVYDAAGNVGISNVINVIIDNTADAIAPAIPAGLTVF